MKSRCDFVPNKSFFMNTYMMLEQKCKYTMKKCKHFEVNAKLSNRM